MPTPHFELLVIPDCPNQQIAHDLLVDVLGELHLDATSVATIVLGSDDDIAAHPAFAGSPTMTVNGIDPLAPDGTVAESLTCRRYLTDAGYDRVPGREQLITAIRQLLDESAE